MEICHFRIGGHHDCGSHASVMVVLDDGTDVLPTYHGGKTYISILIS